MGNLSKSEIYKSFIKQNKNFKKNFKYTILFTIIVFILSALDMIFTIIILSKGGTEQNEIPLYFINHFGVYSLFTLVFYNAILTFLLLFIFNFLINFLKRNNIYIVMLGVYAVFNYLHVVIYGLAMLNNNYEIVKFFLKHKWLL